MLKFHTGNSALKGFSLFCISHERDENRSMVTKSQKDGYGDEYITYH